MSVCDFEIGIPTGHTVNRNGQIRTRVILTVDGQQRDIDHCSLDSDLSVTRLTKRWAREFGIDGQAAREKLKVAGRRFLAGYAARQKQAADRKAEAPRISELADEFVVKVLRPEWHRDGVSLYAAGVGREVRIDSIWKLSSDNWVDRVADTIEGIEGAGDNKPIGYRTRLGMFRDAVTIAGTRAVASLPEFADVEHDQSVRQDDLLADLTAWLLKERRFTPDHGNPIATSYFSWACGLAPDGVWLQCFEAPVFARISNQGADPEIAFKGEALRHDLRYPSIRKLASDLRDCGHAVTDKFIKVTPKSWRVWILSDAVVGQVRGSEA